MEEKEREMETRHQKQNERNLRAQMTAEQLAKYREQRRQNERKRKAKMTEEQLAERRIKRRHNEKNRLSRMTEKELAERRKRRSQQARERRQRIKECHLQTCEDQQTDDERQIEIIGRGGQIASDQVSEDMRNQSAQMIEEQTTEIIKGQKGAETVEGNSDGYGEQNKKNEINQSTHMNEQQLVEHRERRRQNERKRLAQMTEEQLAKRRERRRQQEKQRRQRNREERCQIVFVPQVSETIATKDQIINDQGSQNMSNQHVQSTEEQQPSCEEQNMQNKIDQPSEKCKETLADRRARRRENERRRLAKMTEEQLAARRERRRQQTQQRRLRHRQRRLKNVGTPQVMESTVASSEENLPVKQWKKFARSGFIGTEGLKACTQMAVEGDAANVGGNAAIDLELRPESSDGALNGGGNAAIDLELRLESSDGTLAAGQVEEIASIPEAIAAVPLRAQTAEGIEFVVRD